MRYAVIIMRYAVITDINAAKLRTKYIVPEY